MTDRKHPGMTFWITVSLVVVVVGYPLSLGPACWITSRMNSGASTVSMAYRPVTWGMSQSERIAAALGWYCRLGSAIGWEWNRWGAAASESWHWEFVPAPTPLPAASF
jgi:hypothetical protein